MSTTGSQGLTLVHLAAQRKHSLWGKLGGCSDQTCSGRAEEEEEEEEEEAEEEEGVEEEEEEEEQGRVYS